jgi:hypothetical protein
MAAAHRRLHRHTTIGIDAARIGAHAPRAAAKHPPQRRLRAPGEQVPQDDVDASDCLRERALLARLQRQHGRRGPEMIEHLGRMRHRAPDQHRRQRLVDQTGAVR